MVQLCESVCLMGGYDGKVGLLSKSSNLYLPLGFPLLLPPFTSLFLFLLLPFGPQTMCSLTKPSGKKSAKRFSLSSTVKIFLSRLLVKGLPPMGVFLYHMDYTPRLFNPSA